MTEITAFRQSAVPAPPATGDSDPMPHSIEAEQQLLGTILTNNDVYDRIVSLVKADHFYDPRAPAHLRDRGRPHPGQRAGLARHAQGVPQGRRGAR